MTIKYVYAANQYDTESDAQNAVSAVKLRLDNNPTDWMTAKEIIGSPESGWQMQPIRLTDSELLNPASDKTYMAYSKTLGENVMPLTASELEAKRNTYRAAYAQSLSVTVITKTDDENLTTASSEEIQTIVDMSGYV